MKVENPGPSIARGLHPLVLVKLKTLSVHIVVLKLAKCIRLVKALSVVSSSVKMSIGFLLSYSQNFALCGNPVDSLLLAPLFLNE